MNRYDRYNRNVVVGIVVAVGMHVLALGVNLPLDGPGMREADTVRPPVPSEIQAINITDREPIVGSPEQIVPTSQPIVTESRPVVTVTGPAVTVERRYIPNTDALRPANTTRPRIEDFVPASVRSSADGGGQAFRAADQSVGVGGYSGSGHCSTPPIIGFGL